MPSADGNLIPLPFRICHPEYDDQGRPAARLSLEEDGIEEVTCDAYRGTSGDASAGVEATTDEADRDVHDRVDVLNISTDSISRRRSGVVIANKSSAVEARDVEPRSIALVLRLAGCTRAQAIQALVDNKGDVDDAINELASM